MMSTRNILNVTKDDKDIHGIERVIETCLIAIEIEMIPENWALIKRYFKVLNASGISRTGIRKTMRDLQRVSRLNNQESFEAMTKDGVNDLLLEIRSLYPAKKSDNSYYNHVQDFQIFIRWVILGDRRFKTVGNPDITSHIINPQPKVNVSKNDIITVEENQRMIDATTDIQEKCLIAVSHEAGTRTAELLTRDRKHVSFDELGAVIKATGKTGQRDIRIIRSTKHIYNWMHATKAEKNTPLFIMDKVSKYGQRMTYRHALDVLKNTAKKADIDKKVNFQINRHSGATIGAGILTESQMKIQYGWAQNSTTPARYTHLNESDVDKSFAKFYGLAQNEDNSLAVKKCHYCDHINGGKDETCGQCMRTLDAKVAMGKMEKDKKRIGDLEAQLAGKHAGVTRAELKEIMGLCFAEFEKKHNL